MTDRIKSELARKQALFVIIFLRGIHKYILIFHQMAAFQKILLCEKIYTYFHLT